MQIQGLTGGGDWLVGLIPAMDWSILVAWGSSAIALWLGLLLLYRDLTHRQPQHILPALTTQAQSTLTSEAYRQTEAALRDSERRQRALLHAIPDLMIRMHRDGTILDYKPSPDFKAYLTETVTGKNVFEVLPTALAQQRMDYIDQALQTGVTQVYELQLPIAGELRTHETRIVVCGDDEVVVIVRDVTDRKQAEIALQSSRDLFSATFNESTDAIFLIDNQTALIFDCNQRALELLAVDDKAAWLGQAGQTFYQIARTPEDLQAVAPIWHQTGLWHGEVECRTGQDQAFWGNISIKRFAIAQQPLLLMRITDISDRKQAEVERQATIAALRQSEATNRALISAIPDLLIWIDRDGTYLDVLGSSQSLIINKPIPQLIGVDIYDVLPATQAAERMHYIHQALLTNKLQVYEYQLEIDGDLRDEEARIVRCGDRQVLCMVRDITDRKQAEHALQQEIYQRQQTEATLQETHEKLIQQIGDLEERHQEIMVLNEMSDLMQACLTVEEAYIVIAQLMPRLFPDCSGAMYAIHAAKPIVEAMATWGTTALVGSSLFTPSECLALRRGQPHYVADTHTGLCCQHLPTPQPQTYFCIPMVAQGHASGVLYISSSAHHPLPQAKQQLATAVARQVALAIANLKLYSTLQNQSIRDPLTGLYNRRYLGDFLDRELCRAEQEKNPLSVLLLDVDHFKQFNDTYGHEAGDAVLHHLSQFLQTQVRGSDIACRYGGEEMVLVLPGASLRDAAQRAEQLRLGIKALTIDYAQSLGPVSVSIGVGCFPEHGHTSNQLLNAADAALYQAKAAGRDRVMMAATQPTGSPLVL